ncbi:MAG: hypothetical protein ACLTGI_10665 [Hoylesella buccalis]
MKSQLEMVKTNSSTAARTVATPLEAIKQLNQYYYDETMAINKRLIDLNEEEQQANHNVEKQQEVIDSLAGLNTKRLTVIDVKVDAPRASNANFTFVYYVNGASWYPTYELRSSSTAAPCNSPTKPTSHNKPMKTGATCPSHCRRPIQIAAMCRLS